MTWRRILGIAPVLSGCLVAPPPASPAELVVIDPDHVDHTERSSELEGSSDSPFSSAATNDAEWTPLEPEPRLDDVWAESLAGILYRRHDRGGQVASSYIDNDEAHQQWLEDTFQLSDAAVPGLWTCPLLVANRLEDVVFSPGPVFDWGGVHACTGTDWPGASTPWLALDRDGDGKITGGFELFGTGTQLSDGTYASNGFVALQRLDTNSDGVISRADADWDALRLWSDQNRDGESQPNELTPLTDSNIDSLPIVPQQQFSCDANGNCLGERARGTTHDGSSAPVVVDVYLRCRPN